MRIDTTIGRSDETKRIGNYKEVMNCLGRITSIMPDGERKRAIVDNPKNMDPYGHSPEYLRVSVPRKGTSNFTVIEEAGRMGLVVADIWQMDEDYENERVCFKLAVVDDL